MSLHNTTIENVCPNKSTHLQTQTQTQSIQITNPVFLRTIFGKDWQSAHVASFMDDPMAIPNSRRGLCWAGHAYRSKKLIPESNQYFTISQFKPVNGRSVRRKAEFLKTYVIVADDVGTKLPQSQVDKLPPPSYKLETSPKNYQTAWILPHDNNYTRQQIENLLDGLIKKGLSPDSKDPGMAGVTRYVRLPEGFNRKAKYVNGVGGFDCCITEWNPNQTTTIEALAKTFDIDLDAKRRTDEANSSEVDNHPALNVLDVLNDQRGGKFDIVCPWVDKHTGGDTSGTAIWTREDGSTGFKCHHGSCIDKGAKELSAWLNDQPGYKKALTTFHTEQFKEIESTTTAADAYTEQKQCFIESLEIIITRMERTGKGLSHSLNKKILWEIWQATGRSAVNERFYMTAPNGKQIQISKAQILGSAALVFGEFINKKLLYDFFSKNANEGDSQKFVKKLLGAITEDFLIGISTWRQYNAVDLTRDIFLKKSFVAIEDITMSINVPEKYTFNKKRFAEDITTEDKRAIVSEYKNHFKELDDILKFLWFSRVAINRRNSYLWMHLKSDWGKNFFFEGVLGDDCLNLITMLNVEELEKICSGNPCGLNVNHAARSLAILFDEVKVIKREVKTLDRKININVKNSSNVLIPTYAKVFVSAETIDSFVGDTGVERQFLNRFSCIYNKEGRLSDLTLFKQHGCDTYRDVIADYCADEFTKLMSETLKNPKRDAVKLAHDYLDFFHSKYSLEDYAGSLDGTIEDLTESIRSRLIKRAVEDFDDADIFEASHAKLGPVIVIKKPIQKIKSIIANEYQGNKSECQKVMHKAASIAETLSKRNIRVPLRIKLKNGSSVMVKALILKRD